MYIYLVYLVYWYAWRVSLRRLSSNTEARRSLRGGSLSLMGKRPNTPESESERELKCAGGKRSSTLAKAPPLNLYTFIYTGEESGTRNRDKIHVDIYPELYIYTQMYIQVYIMSGAIRRFRERAECTLNFFERNLFPRQVVMDRRSHEGVSCARTPHTSPKLFRRLSIAPPFCVHCYTRVRTLVYV